MSAGKTTRRKTSNVGSGILLLAKDWLFHTDLPEFIESGCRFSVPHDIILTDLKPDLLIISRNAKILIIVEVTCPNDSNLEFWRKKKRDKYEKLRRWMAYGWTCHVFSMEVSSRGFVLAKSFYELCGAFGIEGPKRKSFMNSLAKTALRCSYVVWINRFTKKMYKRPIIPCDIPHRLLFSKVSNLGKRSSSALQLIQDNRDGITEVSPFVNPQDTNELVASSTWGLNLEA